MTETMPPSLPAPMNVVEADEIGGNSDHKVTTLDNIVSVPGLAQTGPNAMRSDGAGMGSSKGIGGEYK